MSEGRFDSPNIDEAARRRFEADWKHGPPESLAAYVPDSNDPAASRDAGRIVHVDLENRWKRIQQDPVSKLQPPLVNATSNSSLS